jgi:hypothetical protein
MTALQLGSLVFPAGFTSVTVVPDGTVTTGGAIAVRLPRFSCGSGGFGGGSSSSSATRRARARGGGSR